MFSSLLLPSLLSLLITGITAASAAPAPVADYRAIVVDAVSRQPLASVTVQERVTGALYVTDANGRFVLTKVPAGELRLHLSSLGYADTDISRPLPVAGQLDTLRLAPTVKALSEVVVRPQGQQVLAPFAKAPHSNASSFLIPAVSIAVHLPGLPESRNARLQQVQLQLKPTAIRLGAIRVRLLTAAEGQTPATSPALLPLPIEVSVAQLAAAPKGLLTLDLSEYNLTLPSSGVFVVVEGLAHTPTHQFVSITMPSKGKNAQLITGSNPSDPATYSVTNLDDYPQLAAAETNDPARSWVLGSNGKGWQLRQPKAGQPTKNFFASLVITAD